DFSMGNLTLDVFWLHFMPIYSHAIGGLTFLITVLVLYLMITKTPNHGKPLARYLMMFQMCILVADFGWGFLISPIFFFPETALLCTGVICGTETSGHIGIVLMYQFVNQSALAIACTFHYKYTTIVRMKYGQEVSNTNKNLMRLFFWVVLELPVIGVVTAGVCQQELHEFLLAEVRTKKIAKKIEVDSNLHGTGYSIHRYVWIPIMVASLVATCLTIIICCCAFFILQTLRLLSDKTSTMSDRTRKLQRGLTITLVVQVPLIYSVHLFS
ncbi:hypothetical protein PMAYCL1PPCAC_09299, partial [Pristionchus mayeri]